ncbi:MAG: hypothetical protein IIZ78_18200 [Clostridiales bacterium]|nr:hypothetical protein [Clostridiales bacterium]
MDVKTKSGFKCKVNEKKMKDWRFVKALAKCDSGEEASVIEGLSFVVPFLLGEEGEEKLLNHVMDEDGVASSTEIIKEFKEILSLVGSEIKKSQSSQE